MEILAFMGLRVVLARGRRPMGGVSALSWDELLLKHSHGPHPIVWKAPIAVIVYSAAVIQLRVVISPAVWIVGLMLCYVKRIDIPRRGFASCSIAAHLCTERAK